MRALSTRRIATSALCVTLLLGTAGTAFAFAADDAPRDETRNAHRAPAPAPETLLAQAEQLRDAAGVITPASDLLTAVLKAPGNKLSPAEIKKHREAMRRAVDAAGATTTVPESPAAPVAQPPQTPERPVGAAARDIKAPADPRASALTALHQADAKLLRAAAAGDAAAVRAQAPAVVTGMVNVAAATLLAGGLPAPTLPGLPPPTAPATPAPQGLPTGTLPQTPAVPETAAP
ncbi:MULTISPECIES: hypothetical protein [Streptomyces]|uniref:hypothetical protein n=1 Tax=Streptomyces TaxID=1883 RepID=UPI001E6219CC|nr:MULTISPECIES: hypothetical protein [Streptomyces]UFQ17080.1 hypothetical protein J2N69_19880 [Streptomyces huasconensis]WCL86680.1 hypothetical protein PPN52_19885 [Streptomyces sp. JCM 35825]